MRDAPPFVLILGMHRSGTSCLAGCLERAGLHLGDVRRTGRHNARGYFESTKLVRLHDQVLALNRGAWHSPPPLVQVHPYHMQALKDAAQQLALRRPCGIKDPRLLLLLDTWSGIAPAPIRFAGTFRHPAAVVQSLAARDRMPDSDALALWLHYNRHLVAAHRRQPFPIVEYDLSNPEAYIASVALVARGLGLKPSISQLRLFVSSTLEHCTAAHSKLDDECGELYEYLRSHAVKGRGQSRALVALSRAGLGVGTLREVAFRASRGHRPRFSISGLSKRMETLRQRVANPVPPLDGLKSFLLFVGNSRSGTTLVKTVLDAHPGVVLGNEVHVLKRMLEGQSWEAVVREIVMSSRAFTRNPFWTGHNYRVPLSPASSRTAAVRVIGDKKADRTAMLLQSDAALLARLTAWSRAPIIFLHVVRHPLDVIASRSKNTGVSLEDCAAIYFERERAALDVGRELGPGRMKTVYLEDLIARPDAVLEEVLRFMGVEMEPGFVEACRTMLYREPNQSRHEFRWSADTVAAIESNTQRMPHLARYLGDFQTGGGS